MLTTTAAATRLGLRPSRVRQLLIAGELPGQKVGRDWLIEETAVDAFERQPRGWPKGRPRLDPRAALRALLERLNEWSDTEAFQARPAYQRWLESVLDDFDRDPRARSYLGHAYAALYVAAYDDGATDLPAPADERQAWRQWALDMNRKPSEARAAVDLALRALG